MNSASHNPSGGTQLVTRLSSLQERSDNNSESSSYLPSLNVTQTQGSTNGLEYYTFQSSTTSRYAHSTTSFPSRECAVSAAPRESISSYYFSPAPFSSLGNSGSNFPSENFNGSNTAVAALIQSHPEPYRDHHYSSPPSDGSTSIPGNGQQLSAPCPAPETYQQEFSQFVYRRNHEESSPDDCVSSIRMKEQPHHIAAGPEEPYAQLIYRAFMSTKPKYAMTLQDIYQWFRENTDKAKRDGKGWQNSIRHNLSMNQVGIPSPLAISYPNINHISQAFTKVQCRHATNNADSDFPSKGKAGGSENKKSTKWYLEPWAVTGGVQSTARYRKSNSSRPAHGELSSNRVIGSSTSGTNKQNRSTLYAASPAISGRESGSGKYKARQEARHWMRLLTQQQQQQHQHHYPQSPNAFHRHSQRQHHHLYHDPYFQYLQQWQQHCLPGVLQHHSVLSHATEAQCILSSISAPPEMEYDFSTPTTSTASTEPQPVSGFPPSDPMAIDRPVNPQAHSFCCF